MIIKNAIITPDGTELVSEYRHDFKVHHDALTGKEYGVDGGFDYQRLIGDCHECRVILICTESSTFEVIREAFKWGTYGKDGNGPNVKKSLRELTDDHIEAIIKTQTHLSVSTIDLFKAEQKYRSEHSIEIKD